MLQQLSAFVGHFHPLVVHLPIGFLSLLFTMELVGLVPRFRSLLQARWLTLAASFTSALASALCGWFLAGTSDYDTELLELHRWTGVGVAAACMLCLVFYWRNWLKLYRGSLCLTMFLLVAAGHYGGSLTHGNDFLTKQMPAELKFWVETAPSKKVDVDQAIVLTHLVQPILDAKCVSCHGPGKQNGGLRLDSFTAIQKGGANGPVIVPGDSGKSALVARVLLPPEESKHMPPAGKPQLKEHETVLLSWWIDSGASAESKVSDLEASASVYAAIEQVLGAPSLPEPLPWEQIQEQTKSLGKQLGIFIRPIAAAEPWLEVNASLRGKNFSDSGLALLAPVAGNIKRLDLGGTGVSDDGLKALGAMVHLERLDLKRTALSDKGLAHCASLQQLQYLNLYATSVTDAGLEHLKCLRKLRRVYLWQSQVKPEAAQRLAGRLEDKLFISRAQNQIKNLQQQINAAKIVVDTGVPLVQPAAASVPPKVVNKLCPVSGKPLDPNVTFSFDGQLIGFCCGKCCATFQKNPKTYLPKLEATPPAQQQSPEQEAPQQDLQQSDPQ